MSHHLPSNNHMQKRIERQNVIRWWGNACVRWDSSALWSVNHLLVSYPRGDTKTTLRVVARRDDAGPTDIFAFEALELFNASENEFSEEAERCSAEIARPYRYVRRSIRLAISYALVYAIDLDLSPNSSPNPLSIRALPKIYFDS